MPSNVMDPDLLYPDQEPAFQMDTNPGTLLAVT